MIVSKCIHFIESILIRKKLVIISTKKAEARESLWIWGEIKLHSDFKPRSEYTVRTY